MPITARPIFIFNLHNPNKNLLVHVKLQHWACRHTADALILHPHTTTLKCRHTQDMHIMSDHSNTLGLCLTSVNLSAHSA